MKYFVDSNGSINFIGEFGYTDYVGAVVVNEEEKTVYTVDDNMMVTGEYTLWGSLTELANQIENK